MNNIYRFIFIGYLTTLVLIPMTQSHTVGMINLAFGVLISLMFTVEVDKRMKGNK